MTAKECAAPMRSVLFRMFWYICLLSCGFVPAAEPDLPPPSPDGLSPEVAVFLRQYCGQCHLGESAEGDIDVARLLTLPVNDNALDQWENIVTRIKTGEMPPEEADQPPGVERTKILQTIGPWLQATANSRPEDPGRPVLRRMNRQELHNTYRDVLHVDLDVNAILPADELGYGFDNNGDMLGLSPLWIDKCLLLAERGARAAIRAPEQINEPRHEFPEQDWRVDDTWDKIGHKLLSDGQVTYSWQPPASGLYLMRAVVSGERAGDELPRLGFRLDGRLMSTIDVEAIGDETEQRCCELNLSGEPVELSLAFLNDYYDPDFPDATRRDRNVRIHRWECVGPIRADTKVLPRAQQIWFQGGPTRRQWTDPKSWEGPTRKVLGRMLTMVYRRPATRGEVDRLLELVAQSRRTGDSPERAIQLALQAALVSPSFLLIAPPTAATPGDAEAFHAEAIDEFSLASRLSYFLWSSAPDKELLRLARDERLRAELDTQWRRMLADPKAEELARNFSGQWLQTRLLLTHEVSPQEFPELDASLRRSMLQEVEYLMMEVVREDLPISTLINADFTFLDERLANHYGIPNITGENFRKVTLPPGQRGGVVTTAAVLTVTSLPNRTSPVKRGKWILGQMLADEPPPPPPGVPDLARQVRPDQPESLREMLARHRADPSCAVCHDRMDPLGLVLEHYDGIGRWRDQREGHPIDASGKLPDGRMVTGAPELRALLAEETGAFRRVLAEKMLTYALGRGLEKSDQRSVRRIVGELEAGGDRFSALVKGVVESVPFQQRRVKSP